MKRSIVFAAAICGVSATTAALAHYPVPLPTVLFNTSEGAMSLPAQPMTEHEVRVDYSSDNGRIFGVFSRTDEYRWRFVGTWVETDSARTCGSRVDGSPHWGRVDFTFNQSYTDFQGEWSYCSEAPSGTWTGSRAR